MVHIQTPPQAQRYWEHYPFKGVREGVPGDSHPQRYWSVSYLPYASQEDADNRRNPGTPHCHLEFRADLVDRFFWDDKTRFTYALDALEATGLTEAQQGLVDELRSQAGEPEYTQTEAQVGEALHWYLTGNPTEAELEQVPRMQANRTAMVGTAVFDGAFVVTELPTERASE